jgi:peptidoglycan hydrolase FlgJ
MRINLMDNMPQNKTDDFLKPEEKISSQINTKDPKNSKISQKIKEAENVAKEFETIYLDMMLKSMRQTAKAEDESNAHNIFQSMLDGEYTKLMADSQSFGIRDLILNWMKENDPALNTNLKIMGGENNVSPGKNDLQNTKNLMDKMKNDSYFSKMAIEQYKMEMSK